MSIPHLVSLYDYYRFPLKYTDSRHKYVKPSSNYMDFALYPSSGKKVIRMPLKGAELLWTQGRPNDMDSIKEHLKLSHSTNNIMAKMLAEKGLRSARNDYIENMYSLINSHTWMDKVRTTPTKEDLEWMNKVHNQKRFNYFNMYPANYNLPKPSTTQQEKMLPWVASNTKNTYGSKVASALKYYKW